jgi:hypothetical protein
VKLGYNQPQELVLIYVVDKTFLSKSASYKNESGNLKAEFNFSFHNSAFSKAYELFSNLAKL